VNVAGRRRRRSRRLCLPAGTARLVLREFVPTDEESLVGWSCDERVTRHMPLAPRDAEGARRHFASLLRQQTSSSRSTWELAVAPAAGGDAIGACEISLTSSTSAEIGYVLARRYWGRGYATELAQRLIRLAFEDLGVERVDSTVDVENVRSMGVLEKAGMRWEALRRRHARARGRWWDAHLYSISLEDWHLARADGLACDDDLPTSSRA